jgi:probable HAF family extracellular repeat protein
MNVRILFLVHSFSLIGVSTSVAAEFIPLGDFPEGSFHSIATAISADGDTVVGAGSRYESSSGFSDAMRWTQSAGLLNLQTLPLIDSMETYAHGVSGGGEVIVGTRRSSTSPLSEEPFRWTMAEGFVGLGHLSGATPSIGVAFDVSYEGQTIVGTSSTANGHAEAFVWTLNNGMVGLGDLTGGEFSSSALGVSADGKTIVGTATTSLGSEAFRWTDATGMVGLGDLVGGLFASGALAVSSDGTTIVGSASSESSGTMLEAFRWTDTHGMVALGDLPGGLFFSEAFGLSADGTIVVGRSDGEHGGKAFVWDELHGMRDLQEVLVNQFGLMTQLDGWSLTSARDISDDGLSFVGTGINPLGKGEAWLVRLDRPITAPEPGTAAIAILAALLGVASARLRFR